MSCSPDTTRCKFWTRDVDYVRPDCCTSQLRDLAFFVDDLLRSHGIVHWLDYGSLLGALRDGQLIAWDSDVDFGCFRSDYDRIAALAGEVAEAGHWMDLTDTAVIRICSSKTNHLHADLYFWTERDGLVQMDPQSGPDWPGTAGAWTFPSDFIQTLEAVTLYGRSFDAPSPVREFVSTYRHNSAWTASPDTTQLRQRALLGARTVLGRVTPLRNAYRSYARHRRDEDLRLFHDVLSSGPLAGKWRVFGGVVLGLERSGRLIDWDRDIDVVVLRDDLPALFQAVADLGESGFRFVENFLGNDRALIGIHLRRRGFQFDFFIADLVAPGEAGGTATLEFRELVLVDGSVLEQTGRIPYQDSGYLPAAGRRWPCSADRRAELELMYGPNWRTPNRSWNGSAAPYVTAVRPYTGVRGVWTPLEQLL